MKRSAQRVGLNLSLEDFKELIKLVYLGEWMVNSQHDADLEDFKATILLQSVLAAGFEDLSEMIGRDQETQRFFLREEAAEEILEDQVSDYDDHVFWQELASRLAERDLAKRLGKDESELDFEDFTAELKILRERYELELDKHGLDNLEFNN